MGSFTGTHKRKVAAYMRWREMLTKSDSPDWKGSNMRSCGLLATVLLVCSVCAIGQDTETIDHVTEDNVIVLQNGQAYQSEDATSLTWLPGEDVLVLDDDRIVNKDENETVDTTLTVAPDDDANDDGTPTAGPEDDSDDDDDGGNL